MENKTENNDSQTDIDQQARKPDERTESQAVSEESRTDSKKHTKIMIKFVFTRSRPPSNGFQKFDKQKNQKTMKNVLKANSRSIFNFIIFS